MPQFNEQFYQDTIYSFICAISLNDCMLQNLYKLVYLANIPKTAMYKMEPILRSTRLTTGKDATTYVYMIVLISHFSSD